MMHMWKTLVSPHLDYCSQLWAPREGQQLKKLEKILKDFTSKIPQVNQNTYWQRLNKLKMNSVQRRIERYKLIYVWKSLEGIVPECGVTLAPEDDRKGRTCKLRPLRPMERSKRDESFQISGPKLFNILPKFLRDITKCEIEEFKEKLDEYLTSVPDEPKIGGLMPQNFQQSNSLIYQLARRGEMTMTRNNG